MTPVGFPFSSVCFATLTPMLCSTGLRKKFDHVVRNFQGTSFVLFPWYSDNSSGVSVVGSRLYKHQAHFTVELRVFFELTVNLVEGRPSRRTTERIAARPIEKGEKRDFSSQVA